MLSISQTSHYYYCLEWIPSESGLEVVKFDRIKLKHDLNNKNSIQSIINNFNPVSKQDSNSISLSLDIKNVQVSSIMIDPQIDTKKYIKWYEENILGRYISSNFHVYYYPMQNNYLMILCIDKIFRQNLIQSVNISGYNLVDMNIGIFSAYHSVNRIKKINNIKNYLIWKLDKNNIHYISYYEKNNLCCMVNVKKTGDKIKKINLVGDTLYCNKIIDYIKLVLIEKNNNYKVFDKVFIYQSFGDKKNIESILNNNNNIDLLDISNFFKNNENNKLKLSGYVENGTSLKGIDV